MHPIFWTPACAGATRVFQHPASCRPSAHSGRLVVKDFGRLKGWDDLEVPDMNVHRELEPGVIEVKKMLAKLIQMLKVES